MFEIIKEDKRSSARVGLFTSKHGKLETPSFFAVATQGAVKGLSVKELDEIGIDGLLVNIYHIYLRPGIEVIKKSSSIHKFMGYFRTIITDSGGYQIFSLENFREVSDEGVSFKSHFDGKRIFFSPQIVISAQLDIKSDVVVPLDECIKGSSLYKDAEIATNRTIKWAKISKEIFDNLKNNGILFFPILQGSTYLDLRKRCIEELVPLSSSGICIGGLSVGEEKDLRYNVLSFINDNVPKNFLRYFMGYGLPGDILEAVSLGVDLFDCVVPTRFARTGTAFTDEGEIVIRNAPYTEDFSPIDKNCSCYVCRNFSRAYIRHLINVNEITGIELLVYHNLYWYKNFMERIKQAIKNDNFLEFKKDFLNKYNKNDN